jgi:hypothetical protein
MSHEEAAPGSYGAVYVPDLLQRYQDREDEATRLIFDLQVDVAELRQRVGTLEGFLSALPLCLTGETELVERINDLLARGFS